MKPTKNLNRPLYRLTDALYGCGREEWILIRNLEKVLINFYRYQILSKAVVYGNCVASWDDIQKNDCAKEFKQFKDCYSKLLKKPKK